MSTVGAVRWALSGHHQAADLTHACLTCGLSQDTIKPRARGLETRTVYSEAQALKDLDDIGAAPGALHIDWESLGKVMRECSG
jgi:hypothetical protein